MTLDRMPLHIHLQLIGAGVAKVVRHTRRQDHLLTGHGAPPTVPETKIGCSRNDHAMLGKERVDVIGRTALPRPKPEVAAQHAVIKLRITPRIAHPSASILGHNPSMTARGPSALSWANNSAQAGLPVQVPAGTGTYTLRATPVARRLGAPPSPEPAGSPTSRSASRSHRASQARSDRPYPGLSVPQ